MNEELSITDLIARIKDQDANVRAAAVEKAGPCGAAAVPPLADVMASGELEVARAAKRALWVIVRHAGRPGAESERAAVAAALCQLLGFQRPDAVRREALWMLSEIGGDEAVAAIREIPNILDELGIREDARCAVERIPGEAAVAALQDGFEAAAYDFQLALAQSLRKRGVAVDQQRYPCQKLVPKKQA